MDELTIKPKVKIGEVVETRCGKMKGVVMAYITDGTTVDYFVSVYEHMNNRLIRHQFAEIELNIETENK